jgi:hypothetical protein
VKVSEWLAAECPMVIVVNPRRREATVYRARGEALRLAEDDEIDGGDVVPGWRLPLCEIFG